MLKFSLKIIAFFSLFFLFFSLSFAENSSDQEANSPTEATMQGRCEKTKVLNLPPCADSPSECGSKKITKNYQIPFNCIFLQEPIGGKPGYDLYKITPTEFGNNYQLWHGEAIVGNEVGPVQAILTFEVGKEYQGPFGLLYNYLGLIYDFLSGIIIAFVILIIIIGGIKISSSAGEEGATEGKKILLKAFIGMALWFTASVILYTINPTFFSF